MLETKSAQGPSSQLAPALALCILALVLGIAVSVRIDVDDRSVPIALAAGSLSLGILLVSTFSPGTSLRRVLSVAAITTCSAIAIGQETDPGQWTRLEELIWGLALAGLVGWIQDSETWARWTIAACVPAALALVVVPSFAMSPSAVGLEGALSVALTCCALGAAFTSFGSNAISTDREVGSAAESFSRLTPSACWAFAGASAFVASVTSDEIWTALALLGIAAAMLTDTIVADHVGHESSRHSGDLNSEVVLLALALAAALAIAAPVSGQPYGVQLAGIALTALASIATLAKWHSRRSATAVEALKIRAAESRTDALTGLSNRRGFEERFAAELARAHRYGHPLSLLMIDIDDFKQVNDRFGHAAGDHALAELAGLILQSVRSIDIAARFGGEEFAIVLPETGLAGAAVVAERIRSSAHDASLPVSIGGAELDFERHTAADLLQAADAALYRAKRGGKNRIELAP